MIKFHCPSGHRVQCDESQAGKAGKCPQCGVRFQIPAASEPGFDDRPPSGVGSKSGVRKEPQIEFLCPNGHKLRGPASLQGKPGQCPECSSRFQIPIYENEDSSVNLPAPEEPPPAYEEPAGEFDDGDSTYSLGEPQADEPPIAEPAAGVTSISPPPVPVQTDWPRLLSRLWAERTPGAVIEICLRDGETLVPERFASSTSTSSYGLFAVKNANGTYTVTAVAWRAVTRVLFRGMKRLPEDLFE